MNILKKIPKTFISFVLVSLIIWLFITFSKEYTTKIMVPISYTKLPKNMLLQQESISELEFVVKGTGFKILLSKISIQQTVLNTQNLIQKDANRYYFLVKKERINIQNQLPSGLQIQTVIKDTIYLNIGVLNSKKVPLKMDTKVRFHPGSDLEKPLKISPDSVLIFGPQKEIKNIQFLETSSLNLNDISANFNEKVTVIQPLFAKNTTFNIPTATIIGEVEKVTEGRFEIPFTITNLPNNVSLTTLNKTVKVTFVVGLENFSKIDENSFKIECDFQVSIDNNLGYLIPNIIAKHELVKSVKITPNKIDFLIQR